MEFFEHRAWLLPIAIFCARILDVSIGTLRTILLFRGRRFLAAAAGFFEVLIWINVVAQVLQNLDTWYLVVSYAGGFAAGNVVGVWLESKLAVGSELVRVVSARPDVQLAERLRAEGYTIVELQGTGAGSAPVEVLYVVERRRRVPKLLDLIDRSDPDAVYTISDIKRHRTGPPASGGAGPFPELLRWWRSR